MRADGRKWRLHAGGAAGSTKHIASFEPPVLADATSIAKLAHTVNDWCSLSFTDLDGKPALVGILPSMSVLLGTFVTQMARRPSSSFTVVIRGPGNIDVICEKSVLTYKAGVVSQYESILSSNALERLAAVMDSRLAILLEDDFQSELDEGVENRLTKNTNPQIAELLRIGCNSRSAMPHVAHIAQLVRLRRSNPCTCSNRR